MAVVLALVLALLLALALALFLALVFGLVALAVPCAIALALALAISKSHLELAVGGGTTANFSWLGGDQGCEEMEGEGGAWYRPSLPSIFLLGTGRKKREK